MTVPATAISIIFQVVNSLLGAISKYAKLAHLIVQHTLNILIRKQRAAHIVSRQLHRMILFVNFANKKWVLGKSTFYNFPAKPPPLKAPVKVASPSPKPAVALPTKKRKLSLPELPMTEYLICSSCGEQRNWTDFTTCQDCNMETCNVCKVQCYRYMK